MNHFSKLTGAIISLIAVSPTLQAYDFTAEGFYFNILDESEEIYMPDEFDNLRPVHPKCVEITYDPEKYVWRQGSYSGDIQLPLKVSHNGEEYYILRIGEEAFRYSDALSSVTLCPASDYLPEGGLMHYIYTQAFADSGIKALNGSTENVRQVWDSAFANSKIESITLYSQTDFAPEIFAGSLIETLTLMGDGVGIPDRAFLDCKNLIHVYGEAEWIGDSAFEGCIQLSSNVEAESIGACAFKGCTALYNYSFYRTKRVGERAFENCTNLSHVDLWADSRPLLFSDKLHVFEGCTKLKEITIDRKLITDYDTMEECNPFEGCPIEKITFDQFGLSFDMTDASFPDLKEIRCKTVIPPHIGTLSPAQYRDIKVTVPKQVFTQYSTSPYWKKFASLTAADDESLYGVVELNGVYYRYGMVTRNPFGFYEGKVELVNEYTLDDRAYVINGIDDEAFYNCSNLTEVVIPSDSRITAFGAYAFAWSGIKNIDFSYLDNLDYDEGGYNLIRFGEGLFRSCGNLEKVTLPEKLTTIPKSCFEYCGKLSTVIMHDKIQSVGEYAFSNCSVLSNGKLDLTKLINNAEIGEKAFYNANLSEAIFPDKYISIGREAFCNNKIDRLELNKASVAERAFANNLLSYVAIGNSSAQADIAAGNNDISVLKANSIAVYSEPFREYNNWFTTGHVGKVVIEGYNDALCWNWKTWNVDIIENHQYSPATLDEFTEEQYENILVYVPIESYERYSTAPIWEKFKNLKGIDYSSLNSVFGNTDVTIEAGANQIVVANIKADTPINVYSIDGQQLVSVKAAEAVTTLPLPTGIYLVTVSGSVPAKVAVR